MAPGKRPRTDAIQRRAAADPGATPATPTSDAGHGGTATGLPFRAELEAAFGVDFSSLHVNLGDRSGMAAINAEAATAGDRVSFASSSPSKELVAHELTHVQQQRAGRVSGGLDADPALEREADEVGARAARGERIEGMGATGVASGAAVQRKKLPGTIDWLEASGARKLSTGNNANLVYLLTVNGESFVVKAYKSGGPGLEQGASRMTNALHVPGVVAPDMRRLEAEELEKCRQAITRLTNEDVSKFEIAAMEPMPGHDLADNKEVIDPTVLQQGTELGSKRIKSTGALWSLNMFFATSDRFYEPKNMSGIMGNNSNLRYAENGGDVQAIDPTMPYRLVDTLRDSRHGVRGAVTKRVQQIQNFIDDAILNKDSAIAKRLAAQLGLDVDGEEDVTAQIQEGFLAGLSKIAESEVDFAELLRGVDADLYSAQGIDTDEPGYAGYLDGIRDLLRQKLALLKAVQTTSEEDAERSTGLELIRQANQIGIGERVADLALAKRQAATKNGKHGKWPDALTALRKGKNSVKAQTTRKELASVVGLVGPAFTAISAKTVTKEVVKDFNRITAKIIVRAETHDLNKVESF